MQIQAAVMARSDGTLSNFKIAIEAASSHDASSGSGKT